MHKNKFVCPICDVKIPRIKSVYMTNFTKITCRNCGVKIRPERKSLSLIGAIGGALGGGFGSMIGSYAYRSENLVLSGLAFSCLVLVILGASCYFTLKFTSFVEVSENA